MKKRYLIIRGLANVSQNKIEMKIKPRHRKIIAKKIENQLGSYELERIRQLPKKIKLHFHFTDGFSERVYYYRIKLKNINNGISVLYCKLSPIILLLFFNVTFWTVGEKWMERYTNKLN